MALIRPAQPINTIQGSIGGVSFRRKIFYPTPQADAPPLPTPATVHPQARVSIVSAKVASRRRRTPAQHRAAQEARTVAERWRALSEADRQAWVDMAAALQINQRDDSVGLWAAWPLFSAVQRRYALAGMTGPTTPTAGDPLRVDRPWPKPWPSATPGVVNVFWEPVSDPYPPYGSVGCLYASPPRPHTRKATGHRAVFVHAFDPSEPRYVEASIPITVAPPERTPPGAVIDIQASLATPNGEASATSSVQVRFPPPGWGLAAFWWTFLFLGWGGGYELTPDRILRIWHGDYPTGVPDELDLLHPTEKSVGDVLSFLATADYTDTHTVNPFLLARPQSDLPVMPRRKTSPRKPPVLLFART